MTMGEFFFLDLNFLFVCLVWQFLYRPAFFFLDGDYGDG